MGKRNGGSKGVGRGKGEREEGRISALPQPPPHQGQLHMISPFRGVTTLPLQSSSKLETPRTGGPVR